MKKFSLLLALIFTSLPSFAEGLKWFTDVQAAQEKARTENKFALLNFTESDYCGTCVKMKTEIFDTPEFAAFANVNLVLVTVDFPHDTPQDATTKSVNRQLAKSLSIETFPTIVVLDSTGHYAARGSYGEGGARPYIADLEKIRGMQHVDLDAVIAELPPPPSKPVVFVPIPPAATVRYSNLALKAISGNKDRRVATINNETFMVGDTAQVKVLDERVEVVCKEIREDSVLIIANGKSMELKLAKH